MGVFSKIVNKFKFREVRPLDKKNMLQVGVYSDGRLALLKGGRILEDNLSAVSEGPMGADSCSSEEVFLVKTQGGEYKAYFYNGELFLDSISNPTTGGVSIVKEDGVYVGDFELGKFVICPERMFVSEDYSFIDDVDVSGLRMVSKLVLDGSYQTSYYVDRQFRKVSQNFLEEQEAGEYRILTIVSDDQQLQQVICKSDYSGASKAHQEIVCVGGSFFAINNNQTVLIDENGNPLTKELSEYHVFNNGSVLVVEKGKGFAKLIDREHETVEIVRKPLVDEEAGIVAGYVGGRFVMFGYDHQDRKDVDEHIARLLIDKLQGKKFAAQYVSYVLKNEIDMRPTMEAYEYIVGKNLEQDPMNERLQDLSLNARGRFVQALDRVTSERVKRAQRDIRKMEAESQRILSNAAMVRVRQEMAAQYNAKVNDDELSK